MTEPEPLRILTVCTGNICRSPAAERLLAARLGPSVVVGSAGVGALVGAPVDPMMARLMRDAGLEPDGFAARAATERLVRDADLVLPLTRAHRARVVDLAPAVVRRTFTLLEFAHLVSLVHAPGAVAPRTPVERLRLLIPLAAAARASAPEPPQGYDVPDPYGYGLAEFTTSWALIEGAVATIAAAVGQIPPPKVRESRP